MSAPAPYTHTNHPAFLYQDMLADQYRMQSYRRAIENVVNEGDVVADLGTGTGVLAMMAVQAGAKHVYAVENRPQIIPITRQIIKDNKMSDKITVIEGDARNIPLSEDIDVLINELIGDFGTDENIYECVDAIASAHLQPGGRILPAKLRTFLVPVEYKDEYQGLWVDNYQQLDLSYVATLPCLEEAQMRILSHQPNELASPILIEEIDFSKGKFKRETTHELEFKLHSKGRLHGFMGFFQADLTDDVRIDNYPVYPGCHWQTWHWPAYPPVPSMPGKTIQAILTMPTNMIAQGWHLKWKSD